MTNGLVAWYKMNDNAASTVVLDGVGTNNGAAQRNTSVLTAASKVGTGSLTFNGSSDYVHLSRSLSSILAGENTIASWVYLDDGNPPAEQYLLWDYKSSSYTSYLEIGLTTAGKIKVIYVNPTASHGGTETPAVFSNGDQGWHHVVVVISSTGQSIYIDGVGQSLSGEANPTASLATYSSDNCDVGTRVDMSAFFDGKMDDLRIYNVALTPTQVANIYNGGSGTEDNFTAISGGNMLLQATNSAASLLDFTPTEGRLGLWLSTNSGPIAMNTDLKGYISRATPTNWVQVTFSGATAYSTNASDVIWFSDTTNFPGTGSNVLWKIETANTNTAGQIKGAFPQVR
jgi:hypothetical protein